MADKALDKELRKSLLEARQMVDDFAKGGGNEAETSRRVERVFEIVLGYDAFKHITREYAVHGAGDAEYCDFAIQISNADSAKPVLLVEVKGVNVDLVGKHIKQTASYAINLGCEWAVLTNAKEWRLYHISFNQPPETTLVESWDLLNDDLVGLASKFSILNLHNLKQNGLAQIWQKRNVLSVGNVVNAILSQDSLSLLRRRLKNTTDVAVSPEDIVGAIRRLLNETAVSEMEQIKICLPKKKATKKTVQVISKEATAVSMESCSTTERPKA